MLHLNGNLILTDEDLRPKKAGRSVYDFNIEQSDANRAKNIIYLNSVNGTPVFFKIRDTQTFNEVNTLVKAGGK